jgi:hypothetical protein
MGKGAGVPASVGEHFECASGVFMLGLFPVLAGRLSEVDFRSANTGSPVRRQAESDNDHIGDLSTTGVRETNR